MDSSELVAKLRHRFAPKICLEAADRIECMAKALAAADAMRYQLSIICERLDLLRDDEAEAIRAYDAARAEIDRGL